VREPGPRGDLVQVQPRDQKILQAVFEHKVLDVEQIREKCFGKIHVSNIRSRLTSLCLGRYLERSTLYRDGKQFSIYYVTDKGVDQFSQQYDRQIVKKATRSNSICHDIALSKLRTRFEKLEMIRLYLTENMLKASRDRQEPERFKSFSELNSDAAMQIETHLGEFNIAIEYESSEKSKNRYHSKLLDYYLRPDIHFIIYVCTSARVIKAIGNVDRKLNEKFKSKIFFGLFEKVIASPENLIFENINKSQLVLK
jgi:hypothetical protein